MPIEYVPAETLEKNFRKLWSGQRRHLSMGEHYYVNILAAHTAPALNADMHLCVDIGLGRFTYFDFCEPLTEKLDECKFRSGSCKIK